MAIRESFMRLFGIAPLGGGEGLTWKPTSDKKSTSAETREKKELAEQEAVIKEGVKQARGDAKSTTVVSNTHPVTPTSKNEIQQRLVSQAPEHGEVVQGEKGEKGPATYGVPSKDSQQAFLNARAQANELGPLLRGEQLVKNAPPVLPNSNQLGQLGVVQTPPKLTQAPQAPKDAGRSDSGKPFDPSTTLGVQGKQGLPNQVVAKDLPKGAPVAVAPPPPALAQAPKGEGTKQPSRKDGDKNEGEAPKGAGSTHGARGPRTSGEVNVALSNGNFGEATNEWGIATGIVEEPGFIVFNGCENKEHVEYLLASLGLGRLEGVVKNILGTWEPPVTVAPLSDRVVVYNDEWSWIFFRNMYAQESVYGKNTMWA